MASQLTPFSIAAPGFYGLNLSDSPVGLSSNFALDATNCVIDKSGRVSSRKGWVKSHANPNADLSTSNIECIGELIGNDGTSTILAAGGGFLFKLASGTLTTLTYGGGGVAPTISANNWTFCQLNGVAMFWQRGLDPLIYEPAVSATAFRRLNERAGAAGTIYQCNEAISAYGRVWAADTAADKQTVVWSDLLTPHIWTGGTSGSLNLVGVWPSGGDEIVGLAAHNNFLFIFGRKQILIYSGADTPSSMKMEDSIIGIGCIARDSIANTGEDVWFLSDSGVRSMQRTIQEKSAPFRNISKNVHDYIQGVANISDLSAIKSVYSSVNNFYLLRMPDVSQVLCFDTRAMLEDGSARTTIWTEITPACFCETKSRKLYLGKAGYIGEYTGYLDDSATYRMQYYTTWIDFGNPIQKSILKKILLTVIGGTTQVVTFKWAYDFFATYFSENATLPAVASPEYNMNYEYNANAEYGSNMSVNVLGVNGASAGTVLQFGFETEINGRSLSVQKIDLFTKEGRL